MFRQCASSWIEAKRSPGLDSECSIITKTGLNKVWVICEWRSFKTRTSRITSSRSRRFAPRAEIYKEAAQAYDRFLQIAPDTDEERRNRIKGLINFLRFLGNQQALYVSGGEMSTIVPVKLFRDRPIIEVKIRKNSEPLRFVLDTGSGISVISEEVSRRLDIKPITRGGLARAIGGDGKFQIVYGFLNQISIGEVKIQKRAGLYQKVSRKRRKH